MMMVTGPAYAGKEEYCRKVLGYRPEELTDGRTCTPEEALHARCLTSLHVLLRRMTEAGEDCLAFAEALTAPECIVLDEIGCGIVPLDRTERLWREQTGRCGCLLAERAETVIRLYCGIPVALKGELP